MAHMHVLIVNRWHDDFARYHNYIDHRRHRVTYITTHRGAGVLVPELAEAVIAVDDLEDWEDLTAQAVALAIRYGRFDRVIALSEFDLELGAHLRAVLGVPGPKPAEIRLVRDKVAMKECVARAGVRVPRFTSAGSADDVRKLARTVGGPLILKPRNRAASEGVIEVANPSQLGHALTRLPLEEYECEERIEGEVCQVDGVIAAGQLAVMRAARCINTDLEFAQGRRAGWVLNDDPELEARLRLFTVQVLSALGIETSAFHVEVFKAPIYGQTGAYELVFLEIGARVGGSQIPDVWRDLYGIDLQDVWIRLQLGEQLGRPLRTTDEIGGFLLIPEPPEVPCRVVRTTSLIDRVPELYAELLPAEGTILDGNGGYDEIAGRFRFRGQSMGRVEAAIRRVMREYVFEVAPLSSAAAAP
jgi:hypothetical protein